MLSGEQRHEVNSSVACSHPECEASIPVSFEVGHYDFGPIPCICRATEFVLKVRGEDVSVRGEEL